VIIVPLIIALNRGVPNFSLMNPLEMMEPAEAEETYAKASNNVCANTIPITNINAKKGLCDDPIA